MPETSYRQSAYDLESGDYIPNLNDFLPTGQPRSIRSARGGFRAPGYFSFGGEMPVPQQPAPTVDPSTPAPAALRSLYASRSTADDGAHGSGQTETGYDPDFAGTATSLSDWASRVAQGVNMMTPGGFLTGMLGEEAQNDINKGKDTPAAKAGGLVGMTPQTENNATNLTGFDPGPENSTSDPAGFGGPGSNTESATSDPAGFGSDKSNSEVSSSNQNSSQGTEGSGNGGTGGPGDSGSSADGSGGGKGDPGGEGGGGTYRRGGFVRPDRDKKLEARRITAHEGEFVVRPEAVQATGISALHKINARRPSQPTKGNPSRGAPAKAAYRR